MKENTKRQWLDHSSYGYVEIVDLLKLYPNARQVIVQHTRVLDDNQPDLFLVKQYNQDRCLICLQYTTNLSAITEVLGRALFSQHKMNFNLGMLELRFTAPMFFHSEEFREILDA